jgi:uncharacterized protein (DUF927 family)
MDGQGNETVLPKVIAPLPAVAMLSVALDFVKAGYMLLPCRPDKSPHIKDWPNKATTDEQQIKEWWARWPEAMIGLPTGKKNGVWVLDVDLKPEKGINGHEALAQLQTQHGQLPTTWTQTTPRDGRHLIFSCPKNLNPDEKIKSSIEELGPGLDVRGDGAYIIVAPSARADGRSYQTINGPECLTVPPDWLLGLVVKHDQPKKQVPSSTTNDGLSVNVTNASEKRYLDIFVRDELEKVETATEGCRNNTLNKVSYNLARLIGGGYLDRNAIEEMLLASAQVCGLGMYEAVATIKSGIDAGISNPRIINLPTLPPGFRLGDDGLFSVTTNKQGEFVEHRLADPIIIVGKVRDVANEGWGLLVRWADPDGIVHTATIYKGDLVKDDKAWLVALASGGWRCSPHSRDKNKLAEFFSLCSSNRSLRTVDRAGWYDGQYVLPDRVLNVNGDPDSSDICFTASAPMSTIYTTGGTLEEWQETVGRLSEDNSRLVLSICAALAAPLLELAGLESGGFNFVGGSSIGKTTALLVAATVWGKGALTSGFVKSWRATSNGLEGVAATHNDSLLCLDEIGQAPPKAVAEAAYMLANGVGKARADRRGNTRAAKVWRLLVLSTGEMGLADKINADGGRSQAGQEVRLIDIPADAEQRHGLFENLHEFNTAHEFSEALKDMACQSFGLLAPAFITRIIKLRTADEAKFRLMIQEEITKVRERLCAGLGMVDGQIQRVAGRFALCILAGRLACIFGLIPWELAGVFYGIEKCFRSWLNRRGTTGALEDANILRQVQLFLELHGDARFPSIGGLPSGGVCPNRAGFKCYDKEADRIKYYVFPEVFKTEVCRGLDWRYVCKVLERNGHLKRTEDGRIMSRPPKLPNGEGIKRCYLLVFNDSDTEGPAE